MLPLFITILILIYSQLRYDFAALLCASLKHWPHFSTGCTGTIRSLVCGQRKPWNSEINVERCPPYGGSVAVPWFVIVCVSLRVARPDSKKYPKKFKKLPQNTPFRKFTKKCPKMKNFCQNVVIFAKVEMLMRHFLQKNVFLFGKISQNIYSFHRNCLFFLLICINLPLKD